MNAKKVGSGGIGHRGDLAAAAWVVDTNILPGPLLVLQTFVTEIGAAWASIFSPACGACWPGCCSPWHWLPRPG